MITQILGSVKGILASIALLLTVLAGAFTGGYLTSEPAEPSFGAIPGNEVQGNQFIVGGARTYQYGTAMTATTTSVCSFQTPGATTTLVSATAATTMIKANGSTIHKLGIHIGANNWASTTRIAGESITAGNNAAVTATTTWLTSAGAPVTTSYLYNKLLAPNSYINFQIEGTSSPTTGGLRGACAAILLGQE